MACIRCGALFAAIVLAVLSRSAVLAGETIKSHSKHINMAKTFDNQELEYEEGHVIAMFNAQGVGVRIEGPSEPPYKIGIWGAGDYKGDGTGTVQGYGKFIFSDGPTYFERWSGTVANGKAVGIAVYFNGPG